MWKKMLVGLAAVAVGVCLYGIPSVPDVDSASYRAMAEGRLSEVVRPYANRVLHPLAVRWTGGSFGAVAAVALVVAIVALAGVLSPNNDLADKNEECHEEAMPFACLVCAPFFCSYVVEVYLSDLFTMALTVLFFWFLHKERWGRALLLLFLMQTARESTVIVALALMAIALIRRQWNLAVGTVGAIVCAMAAVAFLSRESPGNIHTMGGLVYMGAKVFSNGLANLLGVTVWSDTYARMLPHFYPDPPLWQMAVPAWLPLGGMKAVGVYGWDGWIPIEVLVLLASAFGILPVVLWAGIRKHGGMFSLTDGFARIKKWVETVPCVVAVAGMAGAMFFLLGPFTGRSVYRLVGYAWPLFWIALPWCFPAKTQGDLNSVAGKNMESNSNARVVNRALCDQKRMWALHLVCMWWPVVLARMEASREMTCLLGLAGVAVCLWAPLFCVHSMAARER